jgi:Arc/MetJ family transcription regulator
MVRSSRKGKLHHKATKTGSGSVAALISTPSDAIYDALAKAECPVRTTITLDDELVATAQQYTGIQEKSALVRAALKALVEREAARRLARLGGTQPDLRPVRRRRSKVA